MGVAIRRLDDLKGHVLAHLFDLGRVKFAADQALDGVQRVRRVCDGLALGDLADEAFVLVGKADDGRRRAAAFLIRNDLDRAALENGDAAVCRA